MTRLGIDGFDLGDNVSRVVVEIIRSCIYEKKKKNYHMTDRRATSACQSMLARRDERRLVVGACSFPAHPHTQWWCMRARAVSWKFKIFYIFPRFVRLNFAFWYNIFDFLPMNAYLLLRIVVNYYVQQKLNQFFTS